MTSPFWPETDEAEDELGRRATAALAEIGLTIPVAFVGTGFVWNVAHSGERERIEKACAVAWESMEGERR